MTDLNERQFEVDGTFFTVNPLPAMAGFSLLEDVRRNLGDSLDVSGMRETLSIDTDTAKDTYTTAAAGDASTQVKASGAAAMARTLMRLDPVFVERVRSTLFEHVTFKNETAVTPQMLHGAEDMAFQSPFAVYEVLVRCLAVNFTTRIPASVSGMFTRMRDTLLSSQPDPTL